MLTIASNNDCQAPGNLGHILGGMILMLYNKMCQPFGDQDFPDDWYMMLQNHVWIKAPFKVNVDHWGLIPQRTNVHFALMYLSICYRRAASSDLSSFSSA